MKLYIPIMTVFLLLSLLTISADTIKKDGLEIEVNVGESEFGDILEFNVTAKNTTSMEKTLLATIYLDPEQYKDMKEEHRSTPVYLEVLPNKTVRDVFYLITAYEVSSPTWAFTIDEVYDFIVDENFDYDDYPEISIEMEENMEKSEYSIIGYWEMEKSEDSKIYGNWSWHFKDNGTVSIEEILGAEARMPMQYDGSYIIKGDTVSLSLFSGSPFPEGFIIRDDQLVAKDMILTKINDDILNY